LTDLSDLHNKEAFRSKAPTVDGSFRQLIASTDPMAF